MKYATLAAILTTKNRIAFTPDEIEVAMGAVKARRKSGADLVLGDDILAPDWDGIRKAAEGGVVFFRSPEMLRKRFLFVKANAGGGLPGGQQATFHCYIGDPQADEWIAGGVQSNWMMAVTSLSNLYWGEGYK